MAANFILFLKHKRPTAIRTANKIKRTPITIAKVLLTDTPATELFGVTNKKIPNPAQAAMEIPSNKYTKHPAVSLIKNIKIIEKMIAIGIAARSIGQTLERETNLPCQVYSPIADDSLAFIVYELGKHIVFLI